MRTLFSIVLAGVLLASCGDPEENGVTPVPEAKIDEQLPQEIKLAVYDELPIHNQSTNAAYYKWDLGNNATFQTENVVLNYGVGGTYTLSLTAIGRSGEQSVLKRIVKVYEYQMNRVTLKNIHLNLYANKEGPARVNFPVFDKVNMWVEIKLGDQNTIYAESPAGDKDMPVLWKSPVVQFSDNDKAVLNFDIPNLQINVPGLATRAGAGWGYGFNLYAQDDSGTYLIGSSYWGGSQTTINYDQGTDNTKFTMVTSPIICDMDFHGSMVLPDNGPH